MLSGKRKVAQNMSYLKFKNNTQCYILPTGTCICSKCLKTNRKEKGERDWGCRDLAISLIFFFFLNVSYSSPDQCGSVWLSIIPQSERLLVRFLVRAHAWVTGSVPGHAVFNRQPTDVSLSHQCFSLSLSPSLLLSWKINKSLKTKPKNLAQ